LIINFFKMDRIAQISAILIVQIGVSMRTDFEPAMTVRDVAALLSVDEKTIYRLVTKGEIPCFKVLGSWRFQRHDLAEWIELKKSETKLVTKDSKDLI
jgi:excisionase family DNA binding protein